MTSPVRPIPRLTSIVSAALAGGVSVVQLREKGPVPGDRASAGRAVAAVCRDHGVPFLVNDDPRLAKRLGADGVHVGRGDTPPEEARALLGPDAILGVTVYGEEGEEKRARDAGADYLAVGPFFPSPTKPEKPVLPLETFDAVVRRARIPVFAIGGITARNVGVLAARGAAGVAVVSAIMEAADPRRAAEGILSAFRAGRAAQGR